MQSESSCYKYGMFNRARMLKPRLFVTHGSMLTGLRHLIISVTPIHVCL